MRDRAKTFGRWALRLAGLAVLVGSVVALGLLGWQWRSRATVGHVAVTGTTHAPPDTVRRLARVDSGAVMSEVNRALIADRVERHPWIERAKVTARWMHRTLVISVAERTPVALVVGAQGRPAYYLDRAGYAMPLPDSTSYDVPLVRDLDADYHPISRIAPAPLRATLGALSQTGSSDLVAEIDLQPDGTVRLLTAPVGRHGAVPVRLGTGQIPKKLRTLHAFARQILVTKSDASIEQIDLRFDGQVVTREHPPG